MEFKYRAVDMKPPTTSFPPSAVNYVSDLSRSQQEAYFRADGFSGMSTTTFRVPVTGEALQRELEKEQIRREIIAEEIVRRQELEAEVRRELAMERAMGLIPMQRCVAAPFLLQERMVSWSNPTLNTAVDDRNNIIGVLQPQLQYIESPVEINPSPVIMLPKPNLDLHSTKQEAVMPAVYDTDPSAFGLKKKGKEEWWCELCQVSATCESQLIMHQHGRRHKAKEAAALRAQKIRTSTEASLSSKESEKGRKTTETILTTTSGLDATLQPCITLGDMNQTMLDIGVMESNNEEQLVEKSQNTGGLQNQNETTTEEVIGLSQPQIVAPLEVKPSLQIDTGKVITLAKSDPDLHIAKRKAAAPSVDGTESSEFSFKKKPKVEWSCPLCQVRATCEMDLNSHLLGRKHKAKEAALRTQKIGKNTDASLLLRRTEKGVKATEIILTAASGLDAKSDWQFPQPSITLEESSQTMVDRAVMESKNDEEQQLLVQKSQNINGLANQNGTKTEEAGKTNASLLLQRNEKSVKATEIILTATPELDAKAYSQFPLPSITLEELNKTIVDRAVMESKNEEQQQLVQKSQNISGLQHKKGAKTAEAGKTNASLLLLGSEKSVKVNEIIFTTTPGLDAKAFWQFPQPSTTLEELNQKMVDIAVIESKGKEEEQQLIQKSQTIGGLENQKGTKTEEVVEKTDASMLLQGSEESVKAAEIVLSTTTGLDAKTYCQFSQPSITLEEFLRQKKITLEELNQAIVNKN